MNRALTMLLAVTALLMTAGAATPTALLGTDGAVRLDGDGARLAYGLSSGSASEFYETVNTPCARPVAGALAYQIIRPSRLKLLANGRVTFRADDKGELNLNYDSTARMKIKRHRQVLRLRLRAAEFAGCAWSAAAASGELPAKIGRSKIAGGTTKTFAVKFRNGHLWTIRLPGACEFVLTDLRTGDIPDFEARFTLPQQVDLAEGGGFKAGVVIVCDAKPIQVAMRDFESVTEGPEWIRLEWSKEVKSGSDLDFTSAPNRHPPAGISGRLLVNDGQFAFARRKTTIQRFFGVTVSADAAFPEKNVSPLVTKRLARFGYNSIRLANTDTRLVAGGKRGTEFDSEKGARMDQLVASAAKDGIYVFLDILSSGRTWKWPELGLAAPDGDDPSGTLCQALVLMQDSARAAWAKLAKLVYQRRNTAAGKAYGEDPAVPLVQLSSSAGVLQAWSELRNLPFVRTGYAAWLEARRKEDPAFMEGRVCEAVDIAVVPIGDERAASIRRYLAELEAEGLEKCTDAVRPAKSVALFGHNLGAKQYRDVAASRAASGDFTVGSFDFDRPQFLGEHGAFPCRIRNVNPLDRAAPISETLDWYQRPDRPFLVGSWQAPPPSSWRAATGLLVGAWASAHKWAGIWRDPYAVTAEGLAADGGEALDNQFANDPVAIANDRAVWALFARGDYPAGDKEALVIDHGKLTVTTPLTCGGFVPTADGEFAAGPLAVRLAGSPAAVWATSLGKSPQPLAKAKRILITHLTDMQTDGTLYADSLRDLMQRRGKGPILVRNGTAQISLAVESPGKYAVRAIASDGSTIAKIPSEVVDGKLVFEASVNGGKRGAQYLYLVVKNS